MRTAANSRRRFAGRADHLAALGSAPWTRAPLLLLRLPAVFLAILGASAILSIAAASGPLFVSTLGTASLQAQAASACPEYTLPTVTAAAVPLARAAAATQAGNRAFRAQRLPSPLVADVGSARVQESTVHLFAKPGALSHVHKLTPDTGRPGAWFPDVFAAKIGARPGDVVRTGAGAPIPVAGIYQDMAPSPFALAHVPRFFCAWQNQIEPTAASDQVIAATPTNYRHGPFLITDPATVAAVSDVPLVITWTAPVSHDTVSLPGFDRAQRRAAAAATAITRSTGMRAEVDSNLAKKLAIAHESQDGVAGSVVPIDIAGVVVAGLLVAGAGVFWATHRAREIRLLVARGVSPPLLGAKALLEALPALIAGLVLGYLATLGLVRLVGPAGLLTPGTPLRALGVAAGAVGAGTALIAAIGVAAGRERRTGRAAGLSSHLPWELAGVAVAVCLGLRIRSESVVSVHRTIVDISPLAFVFPIVGATAALVLFGRIVYWLLPVVGRAARRLGPGGYLALRRLAGSGVIVTGLVVGTALPCCLLTYGSTVTQSVNAAVTNKYQTNLGAPHVLFVYGVRDTNPDTHGSGTVVSIYQTGPKLPGGLPAYVLGVDPGSFAQFAFLSGSQRRDLSALHDVPSGQPAPAILVNAPKHTDASSVTIGQTRLALDVVATSAVFPGLRNGARPMLVVERSTLVHVHTEEELLNQVWTSQARLSAAVAAFNTKPYSVLTQVTSDVVVGTTGLLPVTWIFGYLRALAILIGAVAIAGLVFSLAARTRRRTVSYVLSRRMGLRQVTHVWSLLVELTIAVGLGWLAGSGAGAGAYAFIYKGLDLYPALPPPTAFVLPVPTLLATAAVTVAVIVIGSYATHLLAERANPAEILRLE
ncbi:hypothetical protein M6B22_17115 [Jatrophihabitans cynanchi]|uniref:FtsX-like permease family protein n=1 Tax=Jatrophihabitans cynanchi TaxID=2944128 RepID=A0ABY7JY54_9ACTN|nr:hypothetical protein [Jatrophihabitans sp. SB3-54]WAX56242.1 hypothetical protein M6B22_17115 [Jatrophihabitans sp. SB3-54]